MKLATRFYLVFFLFLFSGCATKPIAFEDARGIPESRVLQRDLLKQKDGGVEIRFIRGEAILYAAIVSADLTIDKEPLARLWAEEKFSIWVEPRLYVIGLHTSERSVGNPFANHGRIEPTSKVEIDARLGRRYDVRVGLGLMPLQVTSTALNQ